MTHFPKHFHKSKTHFVFLLLSLCVCAGGILAFCAIQANAEDSTLVGRHAPPRASTGSESNPDTGSGPNPNTGFGSNLNTGSGPSPNTGSGSSTDAGSRSNPNTGSGSNLNTGSAPGSKEPVRLFGRIEELRSGNGASIPLKMQAMTPMRDPSLDQGNSASSQQSQNATFDSFGIDLRGSWSGELTIVFANFDKTYFEFDRVEAEREVQLLKPGLRGFTTVNFYAQSKTEVTQMEPCRIVFVTNFQNYGAYTYALHFGDLRSGTGVTGNELKSTLMKNTLKQLAEGVLEQEVVTRDFDRNPTKNKSKVGYSESVLRFTKVDKKHIYLQAASVSYDSKGKFQYKVILYGTLTRVRDT